MHLEQTKSFVTYSRSLRANKLAGRTFGRPQQRDFAPGT